MEAHAEFLLKRVAEQPDLTLDEVVFGDEEGGGRRQPNRRAATTFHSLHDAWADTTTRHGRLTTVIVACIGEGRKPARARGVLFGRPPKLTPHQRREAIFAVRPVKR